MTVLTVDFQTSLLYVHSLVPRPPPQPRSQASTPAFIACSTITRCKKKTSCGVEPGNKAIYYIIIYMQYVVLVMWTESHKLALSSE